MLPRIMLLFKRVTSLLLLIACYQSLSAQVQQKRTYEISTEKLDSLNREVINVTEDSFRVSLKLPDTLLLKKATMYINDKNAQNITAQMESMMFTITDFNSITIELEVAKKLYEKIDSLVVDSLTDLATNKKYFLTPGKLESFIAENKISHYSVAKTKIPYAKTEIKSGEHSTTYKIQFINAIDIEGKSLRNSNLIIGALIKTLAGARPEDELIDLFVKLNYGRKKKFFSLLGADVGIGSAKDSTDSTGLFRVNEGIANFNWAIYRKASFRHLSNTEIKQKIKAEVADAKQHSRDTLQAEIRATEKYLKLNDSLKRLNTLYIDSNLKRTAFVGGGLKIFHSIPYIGVHFGSIEINGPLFGSYVFAGYYYSPYLKNIVTRDSLRFQNYKHNIYVEAGINAFGSRVPNVLKTVKFKFGMMFPIRDKKGNSRDMFRPESKDVISRLAIEVPLGTVFRF